MAMKRNGDVPSAGFGGLETRLTRRTTRPHYQISVSLDHALIDLQVTLNIAGFNAPEVKNDTWLRFTDQYPEFRQE